MKKGVLLFLVLLFGVLIFSLESVSAACTTDASCSFGEACIQKDSYGNGRVGECAACVDSDPTVDPGVAGTVSGVWLTTLSYNANMVDTCKGTSQVTEFYCRELSGGVADRLYAYSAVKNCPPGYSCLSGVCAQPKKEDSISKLSSKSNVKISQAPTFDSGSSLPWALGIVGVLLIGGAAYWFFAKKGSRTKKRK